MTLDERPITCAGAEAKSRRIRVLLVDHQPLVREGVAAVLERAGVHVVAECGNGLDAVTLFRHYRPDVVLMELRMPGIDGAEATAAMRREVGDAKIVVLTACDGAEDIHRALKAGAQSYVLKTTTAEQLLQTIRAVHAGLGTALPAVVASRLAERCAASVPTRRETDILERVAAGKANKEIAAELRIAVGTVKGHINSILLKMGARDRTHAVMLALSRGILHTHTSSH